MALAVDGFHVLRQIGSHADLFSAIHAEVNKQAVALVTKQIAKADLPRMREIYRAIGSDAFGKTVDSLKSAGPTLKRLDKHHPALKTMSAAEQRALFNALASGDTEPSAAPVKTKTPKKTESAAEKAKKKAAQEKKKAAKKAQQEADKAAKKTKTSVKKETSKTKKTKEKGIMDWGSMKVPEE